MKKLIQFFDFVRRETQVRNHINSALSGSLSIRPVSSIAPNIASNQFYFHDLFRNPPINHRNATNVVLANSLREQGGVRNIISDDGKRELTTDHYEKGKFMNAICPILQEEISDGDAVLVLPCKHCFYPEGIMRWLENNKAECPVCRHKLLSKEVSNHINSDDNSDDNSVPSLVDDEEDEEEEYEDEDEDEDEDATPFTLGNNPDLGVVGNTIPRPVLNPLFSQALENMVRQSMQNRMNIIDASANMIPLDTEENNNVTNTADMIEEDSMDLQMAIYASMAGNSEEVD